MNLIFFSFFAVVTAKNILGVSKKPTVSMLN